MPRYTKFNYGKGRSTYFKSKCNTKPTNRMAKYIRSIVSQTTAPVVRYPRTDPKAFKKDRPFRRLVRMQKTDLPSNGLNYAAVALKEASYYSKEADNSRWNVMKILAITAYGEDDIDANLPLTMNLYANGTHISACDYEDVGDKNHRACIKVIMPPTQSFISVTNNGSMATFNDAVAFVDVYVEFV